MSEDKEAAPGTPEANDLIVRGSDGDPLPAGTRMDDFQSWERVHEGLKLAADAAQHLARWEKEHSEKWRGLSFRLDKVRLIAVQKSGYGLSIREKKTEEVRGNVLGFRNARERFREGLRQASGGMRQLASCHRGDIGWSMMANQMDDLVERCEPKKLPSVPGLIIPPYH